MAECPTCLLDDKPSEADFFGSHEPVANAIAQIVRQEDGGRAVALEGTWGSGKSTVVRLLKSSLEGGAPEPQLGVFVFDAWAHRGDPLRRSFLEKLVSQFEEWNWAKEDQWRDELDSLAQRREDTVIKTTPILTRWGGSIIGAILLASVGFQFIGIPENTSVLGISSGTLRTFGIIAAGLPFLVALSVYLSWRPTLKIWTLDFWRRIFRWEFWFKHKDSHKDDSILSAFYHRTRERKETERIRTPDPTSIEFHEKFQKIVGEALGRENRSLVTVVDNLDRIEAEQALTIWSTMRTFFEFRTFGNHEWFDRFWLLVPFDKDSLRGLWAAEIARSEGENTGPVVSGSLVEAFLDKSFQVRFHVAPPVPSDWQRFFENQMEKALPEHDDPDEKYRVFRVFALTRDQERPTPREAILFINQIGAVHRQWGDEIPLELQALYVGKRRELRESIENLEKSEFVEERLVRLVEEAEWQKYLAALHFNVRPERAMQVWMGSRVEKALLAESYEELAGLSDLPGIARVCEETIDNSVFEWARTEPAAIALAARNLSAVDDQIGANAKRRIWSRFREAITEVGLWPRLNATLGDGLSTVLDKTGDAELKTVGSALAGSLAKSIPEAPEEDEVWDPSGWLEGTVPVLSNMSKRGFDSSDDFEVRCGPDRYLTVAQQLGSNQADIEVRKLFSPVETLNDIVKALVRRIENGELVMEDQNTARLLSELASPAKLSPVSEAVAKRLNVSTQNVTIDEVEACGEVLLALHRLGSVKDNHIAPVAKQQSHLLSRLNQMIGQGRDKGAASFILLELLYNPEGDISRHVGQGSGGQQLFEACKSQSENRPEILQAIWQQCVKHNLFQSLITDEGIRNEAGPLLSALVEQFIENGRGAESISTETFVALYDWLGLRLEQSDFQDLVCEFVRKRELVGWLTNDGYDSGRVGLYRRVLRCDLDEKGRREMNAMISHGLGKLSDEEWAKILHKESPTIGLVLDQLERQVDITLTQQFREQLELHAEEVLSGSVVPTKYRERWGKLVRAIDEGMRSTFLRNVRDRLLWSSKQEALLELYGRLYVDKPQFLVEKADDVVRGLFSRILDSEKAAAVRWATECMRNAPQIVDNCSEGSREDFSSRLIHRIQDPEIENERLAALQEMATLLKLDVPDVEPETMEEQRSETETSGGVEGDDDTRS